MSAPNIGEAALPQRARGYWKARFSAAAEGVERLLEAERAQLPAWLVVGLGCGIAAWFALDEPIQWKAFISLAAAFSLAGFSLLSGRVGRSLGWFALAAAIGCTLIWVRASWVSAPRLDRPIVTQVEGRVDSVDHLASKGTVRLTIRPSGQGLPTLVRLSIDEDDAPSGLAAGAVVSARARLAPPPMALPGTYDFARDA